MIVGVSSCCSSMLIRKDFCLTRRELHLWMSMFGMGAALGRWGALTARSPICGGEVAVRR